MLDFDEELKKFKPMPDTSEVAGAIYDRDTTDMVDILKEIMKEKK